MNLKLNIPYVGSLFSKLYLSRITDNMNTMLTAGIPMIKGLEITSAVVGNQIYADIIDSAITLPSAAAEHFRIRSSNIRKFPAL
jgi:type II secretory pathway component PulF